MRQPRVMPAMRQWWERNNPAKPVVKPVVRSAPLVRTLVSDLEGRAIKALAGVTYPVASNPKRFARNMQGLSSITDAQREYLWSMVWRFRRQIADKELVKIAEERR